MSVVKVQRTSTYVNNAHRSIVLAARLPCNAPFDKVCPKTEMYPSISGAFVPGSTLTNCRKTCIPGTQFGLLAQTARCICVYLFALSGVVSLDFARRIGPAPRSRCTHRYLADCARCLTMLYSFSGRGGRNGFSTPQRFRERHLRHLPKATDTDCDIRRLLCWN